MIDTLKKGKYRWRGKFRHLPDRETLVYEIGVEWLANRLWTIMYRHIFDQCEDVQLIRVKWHEFTFIINNMYHLYSIEIIQNHELEKL